MRCSTHAPYVLRKWSCALLLAWSYFFMHTWRHRGCLSQHGRRKTHAPESEPSWLNSSYRCVRLIRPKRRAEELDRACLQDPAARSQPSQVPWHPIAFTGFCDSAAERRTLSDANPAALSPCHACWAVRRQRNADPLVGMRVPRSPRARPGAPLRTRPPGIQGRPAVVCGARACVVRTGWRAWCSSGPRRVTWAPPTEGAE